jgi:preprotein translocase subunit SecF
MGFAKFGNDLYSGRRSIDFIGRRRTWYTVAAVMCLAAILALLIRGLNPGIEFRGGSEFQVPKVSDTSELIGSNAVASVVPRTESRVSKVGADSVRVQTEKLTDTQTDEVKTALATAYKVDPNSVASSFVGPSWGSDVSKKALQGLLAFLVLVAVVIAAYFRTWKMAAAGLIALLHDLLITVGVYSLAGFEVTPASVIGFLTILGYSLYDTVVVFDKVRENTERITLSSRRTYEEAANMAVNQTLVRSINTSVVALLPVASILFIGAFLLGAGTLKDISLALFVGIAAGTYSSIFIATPLLVDLRRNEPEIAAHSKKLHKRRAEAAQKSAASARLAPAPVPDGDLEPDEVVAVPAGAGGGRTSSWPPGGAPRATPSSGASGGTSGRGSGGTSGGTSGGASDGSSTSASGGASTGGSGGQRRQPRRQGKSRSSTRRR